MCNSATINCRAGTACGLGSEKTRWGEAWRDSREYTKVTGNVLTSAGLMAYLGPFTSEYRSSIIADWVARCKELNIPCAENPKLEVTLGDPVEIVKQVMVYLEMQFRLIMRLRYTTHVFAVDDRSARTGKQVDSKYGESKWAQVNQAYGRELHAYRRKCNSVWLSCIAGVGRAGSNAEPLLRKQTLKQGGIECIRLARQRCRIFEVFDFTTTKLSNPHYLLRSL